MKKYLQALNFALKNKLNFNALDKWFWWATSDDVLLLKKNKKRLEEFLSYQNK